MQRSKQSRWQWVSVVGWVLATTFGTASWAQTPTPTLPKSWVDQMRWRCIGPATMSRRITALTVSRRDPNPWWAASA